MMPARSHDLPPRLEQFAGILQFVPGFGSGDTRQRDDRHNGQGVGIDSVTEKISMEDSDGAHRSEPEQ